MTTNSTAIATTVVEWLNTNEGAVLVGADYDVCGHNDSDMAFVLQSG